MKYFLVFSLLLANMNLNAQQYSIENVYNFEPGDVLQTCSKAHMIFTPVYTYDSIVSKYYSQNSDTLFYTKMRYYFVPPSSPNGTYTSESVLDTIFYTNLTSMASHYSGPVCDTAYYYSGLDSCAVFFSATGSYNSGCFEMEQWSSQLFIGLGGPYYSSFFPGEMSQAYHQLIYFKTQNNGECGSRYSYLNLNESSNTNVFVYPTVAEEKLNVVSNTNQLQDMKYRIFNNLGVLVHHGTLQESEGIDIDKLGSGVYILQLDAEHVTCQQRFIKK